MRRRCRGNPWLVPVPKSLAQKPGERLPCAVETPTRVLQHPEEPGDEPDSDDSGVDDAPNDIDKSSDVDESSDANGA